MAASLPTTSAQAITWQSYGSDAANLVSPQPLDFTTYSQYTFNPQGLFRQAGTVYATGLVVDNLLNSTPVIVVIGPITETVPGYTKTTLQLGGTNAQVTISGAQSKLIVTFFKGTYLGTTAGTNYYAAQIAAGLAVETAFISMFAGSTASIPVGYLLCDGTAISRDTYAGLFAKIGTLYGAGDGSTTFNLPNLTSRVPIGAGTGTGLSTRGLGSSGGAEQVILTATQMPVHTHAINDPGHAHGVTDPGHGHSIQDSGHSHATQDPGHTHAVSDPGHTHTFASYDSSNNLLKNDTYPRIQDVNVSRFGSNNNTSNQNAYLFGHPFNYDTQAGSALYDYRMKIAFGNISLQSTGVGINVVKNGTGIAIVGSTTGVIVQAGTSGITVANAGGQGGATQPIGTVPPYTAVNFVIKT